MRKIINVVLIILLTLALAGCGSASKEESVVGAAPAAEKGSASQRAGSSGNFSLAETTLTTSKAEIDADVSAPQRKVARDVSMVIAVPDVKEADSRIQEALGNLGGYVQSSGIWTEGGRMQGKMTLRVPEEKLDGFISGLEALGQVERKNIGGKDVTEEYYDTAARKTAMEKQEKRLLELLGKAGNVKEMLEIENELARVRGQIESHQARLKVLDNLTEFATVNIDLREPKSISTGGTLKEPLGQRVKAAWQRGANGIVDLVESLILLLVMILPYTPLLAAAGFAGYRLWKKRRT